MRKPSRLTGIADPALWLDLPAPGADPAPSLVIGREPPADWLIPLDSLSRRHARIFWQDTAWWIEDLGSSNGARLNGKRLAPRQAQQLRAQDRLTLGELVLRLDAPSAPA